MKIFLNYKSECLSHLWAKTQLQNQFFVEKVDQGKGGEQEREVSGAWCWSNYVKCMYKNGISNPINMYDCNAPTKINELIFKINYFSVLVKTTKKIVTTSKHHGLFKARWPLWSAELI